MEEIHSDCGKFRIQLGAAITKPKKKNPGSSVQVRNGTLLPLLKAYVPASSSGQCRIFDTTPVNPLALSNANSSSLADVDKLKEVILVDSDEQILEPRIVDTFPPTFPESLLDLDSEPAEIIVKIFRVGPRLSPDTLKAQRRANTEVDALVKLTKAGCAHAPSYLGHFDKTDDGAAGGIVRFVLMSKLPGHALPDELAWNKAAIRPKVEKAFGIAIKAVHDCGVDNGSHMGRNILWSESEEKCYIVDFERADMRFSSSANMPQEWREFEEWSLLD